MTGTAIVLVISLICQLPVFLVAVAAVSRLARRNGQSVKSMSFSFRHGITAEFYDTPRDSARIHH
jgi:hypothetical protein